LKKYKVNVLRRKPYLLYGSRAAAPRARRAHPYASKQNWSGGPTQSACKIGRLNTRFGPPQRHRAAKRYGEQLVLIGYYPCEALTFDCIDAVALSERFGNARMGSGRFRCKMSRQKCISHPQSALECQKYYSERPKVFQSLVKAPHSVSCTPRGRDVLLYAKWPPSATPATQERNAGLGVRCMASHEGYGMSVDHGSACTCPAA